MLHLVGLMPSDEVADGGAEGRVLVEYGMEGILQYLLSVVLQVERTVSQLLIGID